MTDYGLFTLFLFLHIGAAIIAFGPTFAFPIVGKMGSKDPMHGNFAVRINEAMEDKLVLPFAISMPFTGVFLIWFAHINLTDRTGWWLGIGIVLYAIAITLAVAIQRPLVQKMVRLTAGGPPPGAGAGGPGGPGGPGGAGAGAPGGPGGAGAGAPGAGRPAGPPPEMLATAKQINRNGQILGILIVVIVLLMGSRPQF